jgi:AcrR family transcriptional regulator
VTNATRPYRSSLRDEQARATRRRIVDAGRELFIERGYGATTIDAIAERAGVGRKTVFTSAGGKALVLKLAFDWALAGDDEPVAIADRPEVREMMQGNDAAKLLAAWIAMNVSIASRLAALYHALLVAADSDPDAAELLETVERQRLQGSTGFVGRLHAIGGLRHGLDLERGTAIANTLIDPMPYRRLVERHGWSTEEYTNYLQDAAAAALLPTGARRRR